METHDRIRNVRFFVFMIIALLLLSVLVSAIIPAWSPPQPRTSPHDDSGGWDEPVAYRGPGQ